jgi:ankyrin repeat protein
MGRISNARLVLSARSRLGETRRVESVRILLNSRAKVDLQDETGFTALMSAAGKKDWWSDPGEKFERQDASERAQIIDLLVQAHASIESIDADGNTALLLAARDHYGYGVRSLLKAGAKASARGGKSGNPVLYEAVAHNNFDGAKALIEVGENVNDSGSDSANVEGPVKKTILQAAVENADPEKVKIESERGRFRKCEEEVHELLDLLIIKGAEVNARISGGVTALMIAVSKNDLWTTNRLLEAGADPDLNDKEGQTARSLVIDGRNPELLALFYGSVHKKH